MQTRKIPTLVGIMLVLGAVFLFSLAFDRVTPLFSRASPSAAPKNVMFTNITDTSFTVSWLTDNAVTGAIVIDGNGIGTLYDERDEMGGSGTKKNTLGTYTVHSVQVRNARAQTSYHVRILSQGTLFQDGVQPFAVTTGASIPGVGINLEPAYGTVMLPDGQPAQGALVYLTPEGGQALSTIVTSTGSWVVPLHLARTQALTAYIPIADRINETIAIRAPGGVSTATTDTLNDNPVPAMTIGKDYDFRKLQADAQQKLLAQASPAVLGATTQAASQTVAITQPAKDARLTTSLPLIEGTGVIGKQVLVIVGITNPVSSAVIVGDDGIWRYTPDHALSEGKQSVTITSVDTKGKTVALTNVFEVLKSGTQVLGDATPSATIEPTIDASPTAEASLAGNPPPTSGDETPTIMFLILGIGLFVGGTAVLIL